MGCLLHRYHLEILNKADKLIHDLNKGWLLQLDDDGDEWYCIIINRFIFSLTVNVILKVNFFLIQNAFATDCKFTNKFHLCFFSMTLFFTMSRNKLCKPNN